MTEMSERALNWHKWWDGVVATANATPEGIAFIAAGFQLQHTGGGCTAWQREVGDWVILITDSEGLGHRLDAHAIDDENKPDYWLVGAAPLEGDGDGTQCVNAATVEAAVEAAAKLEATLH